MTISVAFGCPFEGDVDPGRVADIARRLRKADEIVLADTIGVATPRAVRALVKRTKADGVHLHDTRGTALANALAALEEGVTVLDSSIGGLGGCPFAPRSTGNVATEDLVYLLEGEGIDTGIELDALIAISRWLEGKLGRELPSRVYRAQLDDCDRIADRDRAGFDHTAVHAAKPPVPVVVHPMSASSPNRSRNFLQPVCGAGETSSSASPRRSRVPTGSASSERSRSTWKLSPARSSGPPISSATRTFISVICASGCACRSPSGRRRGRPRR